MEGIVGVFPVAPTPHEPHDTDLALDFVRVHPQRVPGIETTFRDEGEVQGVTAGLVSDSHEHHLSSNRVFVTHVIIS
ncbi:MAG TPA: hypothetical protein VFH06_01915 [Candidatus Saccharimonadales bacterium]|nr:hypothetical protein [Candidatus Saccharimonadales bacterium]